MKSSARRLICCLLLVTLSTAALAGDSFTARIPASIAAGNYTEAELLIAEAVKIGVITTVAAESYRKSIRKAQERSAPADSKPATASQQSPERKLGPDWVPPPYPSDSERDRQGKRGRIYVTYTKLNKSTGRHYSGRTSMVIRMDEPYRPQAEAAVIARDSNHHVDENEEPGGSAFLVAVVDRFDVGTAVDYEHRFDDMAYIRIRGREQQLIDFHGGAQSDTRRKGEPDRTENVIRAVARDHKMGRRFHEAASAKWGVLAGYTGD
jgi:hypothetical protein